LIFYFWCFNATFSNISAISWRRYIEVILNNSHHYSHAEYPIFKETTYYNKATLSAMKKRPYKKGGLSRTTDNGQATGRLYHLLLLFYGVDWYFMFYFQAKNT
jgi:hypothetical protein